MSRGFYKTVPVIPSLRLSLILPFHILPAPFFSYIFSGLLAIFITLPTNSVIRILANFHTQFSRQRYFPVGQFAVRKKTLNRTETKIFSYGELSYGEKFQSQFILQVLLPILIMYICNKNQRYMFRVLVFMFCSNQVVVQVEINIYPVQTHSPTVQFLFLRISQ